MRPFFLLLLVPWPGLAWDTTPHQAVTKTALDALPSRFRDRLGAEVPNLIGIYCMYPDRYLEMEQFGFVRRSDGPHTSGEIRAYCVRPDGRALHGVSGDRAADLESLVFLFERVLSNLAEERPAEVAKYLGVMSHFVADSLSPSHADDLDAPVHAAIERSLPVFSLEPRTGRGRDPHLLAAAESALGRIYAGIEQNRTGLAAMVAAVAARDEATLDRYRLAAGRRAAGILADLFAALLGVPSQ